jgi:hypothetical protein
VKASERKGIKPQANAVADRLSSLCNAPVDPAMVYMVCFHYAFRLLLIIFTCLKSLRLVRVESAFVCCHGFLIRVIFTQPQQPLPRAIVICVRTPSRLVASMKPSTIARCAIANEYLRRRKHPFCDVTNRTRLEHHVELLSVTITHVQEEPQTDAELQETSNCTPSPILSTANEKHDTVAIDVRTVDMDNTSLASSKSRTNAEFSKSLKMKANTEISKDITASPACGSRF